MPRQYNNQQIRIEKYHQAEQAGDAIDTKWMVHVGLSTNRTAARKMLNRDCHAGILESVPTRVRCYRLKRENVTLHAMAVSNGGKSVFLSCKESSSCNTKRDISTPRVQRHRARKRAAGGTVKCSCVGDKVCDPCYYGKFGPVTALHALGKDIHAPGFSRASCYGAVGSHAKGMDRRFFDTLDTVFQYHAQVHNLAFVMHAPAPNPELFEHIHTRNGCFQDSLDVNGVKVNFRLYRTGYLEIQPNLDEEPLNVDALGPFMSDIQGYIPWSWEITTPPIEEWLITSSDINMPNMDVHDQSWSKDFRLPIFIHEGSKVHVYVKPINGRRYLRVELTQERPDVTLSGFSSFVQKAERKLWDACGNR